MDNKHIFYFVIFNFFNPVLLQGDLLYKKNKFPYSRCKQTSGNVVCEKLNVSKGKREKASLWPPGLFAIPMSKYGCPESQSRGWSKSVLNVILAKNNEKIELKFCVKTRHNSELDKETWMPQKYAIYKKGATCPSGFEEIIRTIYHSSYDTYGNLPNIAVSEGISTKYINITMCERNVTNSEELDNNPTFGMLDTIFMLIKNRDYRCPQFNNETSLILSVVQVPHDTENMYCLYDIDEYKIRDSGNAVQLISDYSFHHWPNRDVPESTAQTHQTWYTFDLRRSLHVFKIELLSMTGFERDDYMVRTVINAWVIGCYYDEVMRSIVNQKAMECRSGLSGTHSLDTLYLMNVRARFVTLLIEEHKSRLDPMYSESFRVFISDLEALDGEVCNEDLGMKDGSIQDFQITASSWIRNHQAAMARPPSSGWCTDVFSNSPWILVNLIAIMTVEGLSIWKTPTIWHFGLYDTQWSTLDLYHWIDADDLRIYDNTRFRIDLEKNRTEVMLPKAVKARFIKLVPQTNGYTSGVPICLRFEIHGCKMSGIPALNCYDDSEMFGLETELITADETLLANTSLKYCSDLCLLEENCSSISINEEGVCVQYMHSQYDIWKMNDDANGNWSAKLCSKDPVELFPTFLDKNGKIAANVQYVEKASVITSIGYPFSTGRSSEYRWIINFQDQRFVRFVFTNLSICFESYETEHCQLLSHKTEQCQDKLIVGTDLKDKMKGITIDDRFNGLAFVVETSETVVFMTFMPCVTKFTSTIFRAIVTKEETPACLSIDSYVDWSKRREESCTKSKMILSSMSILNLPFVHVEEKFNIRAKQHHSIRIQFIDFYIVCPTDVDGIALEDMNIFTRRSNITKACSNKFKKCYNIFAATTTWTEAESVCWKYNQHLLTVQSKQELQYINYLFREQRYRDDNESSDTSHASYRAHIGLRRISDKGKTKKYIWVNNYEVIFTAWKPEHPTVDDCTRTYFLPFGSNKTWESEDCYNDYADFFICQTQIEDKENNDTIFNTKKGICNIVGPRDRQKVMVTYSGKTCQNWGNLTAESTADLKKRFPGNLKLLTKSSNDCKDPFKEGVLGCYTTDVTYLWEPCFLPQDNNVYAISENTTSNDFECGPNGTAIPMVNRCDKTFDCEDLSDELFCMDEIKGHDLIAVDGKNITFLPERLEQGSYHLCGSKEWISVLAKCDGVIDCLDASDEVDCSRNKTGCGDNEFSCEDGSCIKLSQVCDFIPDCAEAKDESCSFRSCQFNEFSCANGQCIPIEKRCNAIQNCLDESDELDCVSCQNSFHCDIDKCIPHTLVCDKFPDCDDGSDENNCGKSTAKSCDEWWNSGYHESGQYVVDGITVYCDFSLVRTADGHIKMEIRNLDVDIKNDLLYTKSITANHLELSNEETPLHNLIYGANYSCQLEVKSTCHFPDYVASVYDGQDFAFPFCHCMIQTSEFTIKNEYGLDYEDNLPDWEPQIGPTLGSPQIAFVPPQIGPTFGPPQIGPTIEPPQIGPTFGTPQIGPTIRPPEIGPTIRPPQVGPTIRPPEIGSTWNPNVKRRKRATFIEPIYFDYESLWKATTDTVHTFGKPVFRQCGENGKSTDISRFYELDTKENNKIYVSGNVTGKKVPVDISVGQISCFYEHKTNVSSGMVDCDGDNTTISISMLCMYDVDATGYMTGCRSGSHLQNCDSFTCPENTVKCPGSYCIPLRFVCDGNVHCPGREDEHNCFCTVSSREVIVMIEDTLHQSDSKTAAVKLAKQFYSSGSIVRLLHYKSQSRLKNIDLTHRLLGIQEENINDFEAFSHRCGYKSMARNLLPILRFTERRTIGIVFIEDSVESSTVAEIMFSNLSKPASTLYRVLKGSKNVINKSNRYTFVKDVHISRWDSLQSTGYRLFPEICQDASHVPCVGGYRCSSSKQCIPLEQVCDGVIHCSNGDDENLCDFKCQKKCTCVGEVVNCRAADLNITDILALSMNTRSADISMNPGIKDILSRDNLRFPFMFRLDLSLCEIEIISVTAFSEISNLMSLNISYNRIKELSGNVFIKLGQLTYLNLDGNYALNVVSSSAFKGLTSIKHLRIVRTRLKKISSYTFSNLILESIDISYNNIEEIENHAFSNISVKKINFEGNNILKFHKLIFSNVTSLQELRTPAFKFCCVSPCYVDEDMCYPSKNEFSSCADLMRHPILQAVLWQVGIASLLGNLGSIVYRLVYDRERLKIGYGIFVTNLAAADLLMGVYLIMIAVVDSIYRKRYIFMDDQWRNSIWCTVAGVLSTVSSEASVLFLCLITFDRLLVIKYPFGTVRFTPKRAYLCCGICWVIAITLAVIPLVYTSHFQNKFYSRSGVCIALPLTRDKPPGWVYSVSIFVGLNFSTFILVAVGQLSIFLELRRATHGVKKTLMSRKRDLQVARNLILVATTDFLCWFPIGLMGIMALNGYPISGDAYAWTAVFILPFNSALNPFLYTISAIVGKKSFNPSIEEQSRTEVQKEIGSAILQFKDLSQTVRIIRGAARVGKTRSVQDVLKEDGYMSVTTVTAISNQLANYLQLLHESSVGIEQLSETNTYIRYSRKKAKRPVIFLDTKMTIITDEKMKQDNIRQFGLLLRKMIARN